MKSVPKQGVYILQEEIHVFVISQEPYIGQYAHCQQRLPLERFIFLQLAHGNADHIVCQNAAHKIREERWASLGIKIKGRDHQPDLTHFIEAEMI